MMERLPKRDHKIWGFRWDMPQKGQEDYYEHMCDIYDRFAMRIIINRWMVAFVIGLMIGHLIGHAS